MDDLCNGIIDMQRALKWRKSACNSAIGLRFFTKGENVKYYGYGPYESYSDKHLCTYLDEFNTTVSDMYEPYIKNHRKTEVISVQDMLKRKISE